jgi:arabinofuranosyltransferase
MPAWRSVRYLLVLSLFTAHVNVYMPKAQDDAFITLRYARNLASGAGLVYNEGERVEGFSNFLYTVVLAGLIRVGADPLLMAKAIGLIAGCLTIVLVFRLAAILPAARHAPWIAALLLAGSPAFAAWSALGLETTMFSALVLTALLLTLHDRPTVVRTAAAGLVFALVAMTRPEGAIFYVVTAAFLAAARDYRRLVPSLVAFAAVFGAFLIWRVWYFGDLLPNTYYAKSGFGVLGKVRGAKYVYEFFRGYGGAALPFLVAVPLFWRSGTVVRYLAALTAAYLGFVVWVGGDNFTDFRFIVPILALLYLLAAEGLMTLIAANGDRLPAEGWRRWAPAGVLLSTIAIYAVSPTIFLYVPALKNVAVDPPLTDANGLVTIGEWLRGIAPADSTIAVGEAGAIPYITGWKTLDAFGLSDREIARAPRVDDARGRAQEIAGLRDSPHCQLEAGLRRVLCDARIRHRPGHRRRPTVERSARRRIRSDPSLRSIRRFRRPGPGGDRPPFRGPSVYSITSARSQRCARSAERTDAASGLPSLTAAFLSTCRVFRMPGITVDTVGSASTNRSASSGKSMSSGMSGFRCSTRASVCARFSGVK